MGGADRVRRHHESGRLTARERIALLVDPGTFRELGLLALPERRTTTNPGSADGIITGMALVDGRQVAVIAIDATVHSGTTAPINARKQVRLVQAANKAGLAIIVLADADGGRMPDLMGWRFGGLPLPLRDFLTTPTDRPTVLRLCAALGPCYGDSGLQAVAADYTVMTSNASIALSGPTVVERSIGGSVDHDSLGGPKVAAGIVGSAHAVVDSEEAAIAALKRALTYLPSNADLPAPTAVAVGPGVGADRLADIVPASPRKGYDMGKVIECIVDADSILPWRGEQAKNLITSLARIDGNVVGIVANQPMHRGGILDVSSLDKYLDFIDLCDVFNIPMVTLHDVPGLMIGIEEEQRGILRRLELVAAKVSTISVPRISVIVRKSYGGGYFLMGGRQTEPDLLVAWPTAEVGFMAPETGVATVHRRELETIRERDGDDARQQRFDELAGMWALESEPWEAAAGFHVDDVIDPIETREVIRVGIEFAWGNRRRVSSRSR